MRLVLAVSLLCGGLLAAGCGSEADVALVVDVAETPAPAPESGVEAGAATALLVLGCGAPFTREATPATLAAVFGRENVIPETIAGPEGAQLNVTAIYPTDPARRIEVVFRNEEERTDLSAVMVSAPGSQWIGPGGVKIGDGIEAVEWANGMPFEVMGFQWDYGGFVADWKGGRLAEANGCVPTVRLSPGTDSLPLEIIGDGVQPASTLPAMRAAQPKVSVFGISWVPQT
jgi:hypothetical protein